MTKRNKIIYWIATLWLSSAMLASGIMQLVKAKAWTGIMTHLGYPLYFMSILGVWKIVGVLALLIPRFPLLKEWAYAGFFFTMSGALFSHLTLSDKPNEILPAVVLIVLTIVSWYFRPADRKIAVINS
jgi:uncharacterized membrane protein